VADPASIPQLRISFFRCDPVTEVTLFDSRESVMKVVLNQSHFTTHMRCQSSTGLTAVPVFTIQWSLQHLQNADRHSGTHSDSRVNITAQGALDRNPSAITDRLPFNRVSPRPLGMTFAWIFCNPRRSKCLNGMIPLNGTAFAM
jgi:hypothetical protein